MVEKTSVFYRTCSIENKAPRPSWYSKELCLKSIIIAFNLLQNQVPASFTVLHDGEMNRNREWSQVLKQTVEPRGQIIEQSHRGNSASFMESIYRGTMLPEDEIIIFSEDDYLWLTPALIGLFHALTELPADYATAYDHPVRYQPDYSLDADYPHWHNYIYITEERHWRQQESTCMTFATEVSTLKNDVEYFEKYQDNGKGSPEDRELFREMQGLGPYRYKDWENPRLLLGPLPSLNTHAHLPWLAPLIDWDNAALQVEEEYRRIVR